MAPPKKINFPPIQNGLDYLKSTVHHLREQPTARDLKYAVLHLQAAVEVLLKVRLIREHWTLVFSKPNQASQAAFATGDFTSIGLDDTITRLKGIVGITLKPQAERGFKRLSRFATTSNTSAWWIRRSVSRAWLGKFSTPCSCLSRTS